MADAGDVTESRCAVCEKIEDLKRCSRCHVVHYCSREHQKQHWKVHKTSCVAQISKSVYPVHLQRGSQLDDGQKPELFKDERFDARPLKLIRFPKPQKYSLGYLAEFAIRNMTQRGFSIIDNFCKKCDPRKILEDVKRLQDTGVFKDGRLSGGRTSGDASKQKTELALRGDKITWLHGNEDEYPHIKLLVDSIDSLVAKFNLFSQGQFVIGGRTKIMATCYPGGGSGYIRHVDNPNEDGRHVTCLFYLNENWDVKKSGGLLRIFPNEEDYVDVEPIMNRLLLFWSDMRNPHEVQPAFSTRYAITTWYYDKSEREKAKMDKLREEISTLKDDMVALEVEKRQAETDMLKNEIETKTQNALKVLSDDELEAITALIDGQSDPLGMLTQMGVAPSIQTALMEMIEKKKISNTK
ncbi:prolyl hydroxylase EGLN3-like [Saccoglossus kowalevskii]|uniref:hypoxia-inducible factor-proline dioxygenase n=1 Tax=Saccoglossus kowalevskii TaxID=10224 RepID=A0A1B1JCE5_SACKO|nr:PREDICTED: egl nine homolog 1-like [Saccoglossus kowalevskii]ANS11583.1 egl nine 1-like protein [Saccoglossus kowalevskii]